MAGEQADPGDARRTEQVAALQRLGIDVWRRRPPRAGRAPPAPSPAPAPQPARQRPAAAPPSEPARPAPPAPVAVSGTAAPATAFRIRCFHFGGVFAAIAEDAAPQLKLLQDVALALNRFTPADRNDLLFDWPLPGAPPNGAERAFRAFFGHQTRNAPRTLVAGAGVAQLLGCTAPADCALLDGHLYVPTGPLDVAAKKALWRLICESDRQ